MIGFTIYNLQAQNTPISVKLAVGNTLVDIPRTDIVGGRTVNTPYLDFAPFAAAQRNNTNI